jgi:hypothetical protein
LIVEYELIDASRSKGAQAAVEYHSKISLHFGKDFAIFCEGEWRPHINKNNAYINCVIFNKDNSHKGDVLVIESILILISEGAQVAPATLQTFTEGDQATPQNLSLSLKFIVESLSEGAQIAPTTFRAFELIVTLTSIINFQLVVEFNLILHSKGTHAPSFALIGYCSSQISFHFCNNCRIFCEGVKEQINNGNANIKQR